MIDKKEKVILTLFFIFWFLFFFLLWRKMLVLDGEGLWAGWVSVWGDWAAHITFTTSFAYGDNFNFRMPILADYPFSYTFMADLISAFLIKLGLNLINALIWPSIFLSFIFVVLYFYFTFKLTKNFRVALITPFLFLFNGGLGFFYFFQDLERFGIKNLLISLPREYTNIKEANILWMNNITSELIPQRSILLGLPIFLVILTLLRLKKSKNLFRAGLLVSLLPLVHFHFFFSSLIIVSLFFIKEFIIDFNKVTKKSFWGKWFCFFLPVVFLAVPQILFFYPQLLKTSFFKFYPGWLAFKKENFLFFWIKNQGLLFFLIPLGLVKASKEIRGGFLPFVLLFILGNLFIFQPWPWDNTKIFTVYFLYASILAALAIENFLKEKRSYLKFLGLCLIFLSVFSGLLDNLRLFQYQYRRLLLLDKKQIEVAEWVRSNTPKDSLFLTSDNHDHPVPILTGRPIVLGFRGWLWTYGIDYKRQERDVRLMFKGDNQSLKIMKDYGVDYIFIGPFEKKSPWLTNITFFETNFEKIYDKDGFEIFRI